MLLNRLLEFMLDDSFSVDLKVESAIVFGSLAKGPDHISQCIVDAGVMPALVKGLGAEFILLFRCVCYKLILTTK